MSIPKPLFFLSVLAPLIGGCNAPDASRPTPDLVRGVASSFIAARAFDRVETAVLRQNMAQVEREGRAMRRISQINPALLVGLISGYATDANRDFAISRLVGGEDKIRFAETSNLKYRAALAFAPPSPENLLDARTLNALGYFLADKGSTREDFERAAILTRAAYRKWDLDGIYADSNELGRAVSAQDSYAWALYKLGKTEEARRQQEKVWDLTRGMGASETTAEIPYHLGEIYRALGEFQKAREAHEAALELSPSKEVLVLIEGALRALELRRA